MKKRIRKKDAKVMLVNNRLEEEHSEMKKALTRISEIPMFSDQQTLSVQKAIVIAEECLEDIEF